MSDASVLLREAARPGTPEDVVRALRRGAALCEAEDQRARDARAADDTKETPISPAWRRER